MTEDTISVGEIAQPRKPLSIGSPDWPCPLEANLRVVRAWRAEAGKQSTSQTSRVTDGLRASDRTDKADRSADG